MPTPEPLPPGAHDPALAAHLQRRDIRCKKCDYNLRDLLTNRCPECGTTYMLAGGTPFSDIDPADLHRFKKYCSRCGYDATGLTSSRCPECGADSQAFPRTFVRPRTLEEKIARGTFTRVAALGHFLGLLATGFGVLSWLMLLFIVVVGMAVPWTVRPFISLGVAGLIAPITLMAAVAVKKRHARAPSPAIAAIHLALSWAWAAVFVVVWILV